MAVGSVHQEICVFGSVFNCFVEVLKCIIIPTEGMVAAAKSIKYSWVSIKINIIFYEFVFFLSRDLKVINSTSKIFDEVLAKTSTKVAFWKVLIDRNSSIKVSNSQLMITHILINSSSCNIHCLVIIYFLNNFWKAFKSILETISPVLHETKMELTADEIWLQFESLLIHVNSQLIAHLIVVASFLENVFGLSLESKTFRMP